MKFFIVLVLLCSTTFNGIAQIQRRNTIKKDTVIIEPVVADTPQYPIIIKRSGAGNYIFMRNEEKLSNRELNGYLSANPGSAKLLREARTNGTLSYIVGFAGGYMVGYSVAGAIFRQNPKWGVAGIGLGLIALSIPLNGETKRLYKAAVLRYNQDYEEKDKPFAKLRQKFSIIADRNSAGIAMKF